MLVPHCSDTTIRALTVFLAPPLFPCTPPLAWPVTEEQLTCVSLYAGTIPNTPNPRNRNLYSHCTSKKTADSGMGLFSSFLTYWPEPRLGFSEAHRCSLTPRMSASSEEV